MTCLCVLVFTLVLNAPVLLNRLLHALTVTTDADPPVFSAYLGQLWSMTQYKLELSEYAFLSVLTARYFLYLDISR